MKYQRHVLWQARRKQRVMCEKRHLLRAESDSCMTVSKKAGWRDLNVEAGLQWEIIKTPVFMHNCCWPTWTRRVKECYNITTSQVLCFLNSILIFSNVCISKLHLQVDLLLWVFFYCSSCQIKILLKNVFGL